MRLCEMKKSDFSKGQKVYLQNIRKPHSFRGGMDSTLYIKMIWNEPYTNVNVLNGKLVSESINEIN